MKRLIILIGLIVGMITTSNCSPNNKPHSTIVELSPQKNTRLFSDTVTPTLGLPMKTTSEYMSTSTLTNTIPFIPTLPTDEAYARLFNLLSNNGNCLLPCFWGIIPGRSNLKELKEILIPLSSISLSIIYLNDNVGVRLYSEDNDLIFYYLVDVYTKDNIVDSIQLESYVKSQDNLDQVYDSQSYADKLSYYLLPHILEEYGLPSTVFIKFLISKGGEGGFLYILLLFPDQGILVYYETATIHLSGMNYVGCPSNAAIRIILFPSDNANKFMDQFHISFDSELTQYKTLEEATSLSIEQFSQLFRKSTSQCLSTPIKLWPTFTR